MSNLVAYIAWDADKISKRVEGAVTHDKPDDIAKLGQNIKRGNEIMRSWLEENDGQPLLFHGDEGYASLPSQKLEELQDVHSRMEEAYGDGISIGIGLDLSEAKRALDLAIKRGGSRLLFYTPEVDEELNDDKKKDPLSDLLGKADPTAGPQPQTVPENSPAGGGGFSGPAQGGDVAPPASPQMSASEHSQGEGAANFMEENMPAAPSATNAAGGLEGQFHQAAMQGEQEGTNAEGQAQAADGGGPPSADQLKAQLAQILMQVKEQAPILEQLKQQAPQAYEAIVNVVNAMMLMARELMTKPEGQGGEQEGQDKKEGPAKKSEGENSGPLAKATFPDPHYTPRANPIPKAKPRGVVQGVMPPRNSIKVQAINQGHVLEGYIPDRFKMHPVGKALGGGYQSATHELGDKYILKIQAHVNPENAKYHLDKLARLKKLGLSTVVPILSFGHFTTKVPYTYTYEILKRAHPHGGWGDSWDRVQNDLSENGFRHMDAHGGNIMEDTLGNPMAIDLEAINEPGKSRGLAQVRPPPFRQRVMTRDWNKRLGKSHPPFVFPKLGLPDDRRETPIISKLTQLRTRARAMSQAGFRHYTDPATVFHPTQTNDLEAQEEWKRRDPQKLKDIATDLIEDAPNLGASFTGPKRTISYALNEGLRSRFRGAQKGVQDVMSTVQHENLHLMLNRVEQKYGQMGRRHLVQNLLDSLPTTHQQVLDTYIRAKLPRLNRNPTAISNEERLAHLFNYLQTSNDRDGFHKYMNHTPEQRREFGTKMKQAYEHLRAAAGTAGPEWTQPRSPWKKEEFAKSGIRITGGPMPESQVPPSGHVQRHIPPGNIITRFRGNREQKKVKVVHTDPSGKEQIKDRQMDSGMATPDNPQEAISGKLHPISTLAPKD